MAIRVGQLNVQYAADTADASDVRVTRLFSQAAIIANGATIVAVSNTIFADATDNKVEQAGPDFFFPIANTIFDGASDNDATYDPVFNVFVGHQLFGAAGDDNAEALYQAVSQTLFTLSGAFPDESRDVTQYLGFTDRRIYDIGHTLFRYPDPGIVSEAAVATAANIIFSGSLANTVVESYNADNSLGWTETIVQTFTLEVEDVFGFSEDYDLTSNTYARDDTPAPSTGFLRQSISINVDNNDCRQEQYAPIIGTGPNDEYEDFAIAPPSLSDASGITLTYPATGTVTDTLILENPNFGNEHTNAFTRIDRPTRGGDRKIYSDPKWAHWERFRMTITGIGCGDTPTLDQIVAFLNTTLGKEINLVDWESREWRGIIVAPETNIIEEQEGLRLELIFEGALTSLEVQYDEFDVIHGQDSNGDDIDVTYEE